ncbi:PXR1 [Candida jiufengensis]|uniref:PXR1 n=1 Tax=Candida jiufengensis TaxID=497108 RepID=UPI002225293F|nr:PXR1 [Candida jiufengensis]KAI5955076.1 PXR1 [Candida jiufengensis]
MGLAGTKVKQNFGLDPRNTNWSNDTTRFGHQYLSKMGWKSGKGLGITPDSITTHLKIHIKQDNSGLGAKLKKADKDKDLDECSGLDAFQRILGRLNGKEDKINKAMDLKRNDEIINGKWGMRFVKGEVLSSTWDKDSKKLISYKNDDENNTKKRSIEEESEDQELINGDIRQSKKIKLDAKDKKSKKEKKEKKEKKDKKDKKSKKRNIEKDEILEKKDKKSKKSKSKDDSNSKDKKEKKDKKNKKNKTKESSSKETSVETDSRSSTPTTLASRHSARSKWIKQKRASVMDPKALNEIFMITK